MNCQHYRHAIVCLNGAHRTIGKYQLHIFQISQSGQTPHHARWNFQTFKGLLAFLKKHFPDSELVRPESMQSIRFQAVQRYEEIGNWLLPTPTEKVIF